MNRLVLRAAVRIHLRQQVAQADDRDTKRLLRRAAADADVVETLCDVIEAQYGDQLDGVAAQAAADGTPIVDAILKLLQGLVELAPAIIAIVKALLPLFVV